MDLVLVDLATSDQQAVLGCEPPHWPAPSIAGDLMVSVERTDDPTPSARIVAADLSGHPIELAANPWSAWCERCELEVRLAPSGTSMVVTEILPEPTDLGVASWPELDALPADEIRSRWNQYVPLAEVRIRVISLATGEEIWATTDGVGSPLDFDDRYLVYRFEGRGHHATWPMNMSISDILGSGDEATPIRWVPDGVDLTEMTLRLATGR